MTLLTNRTSILFLSAFKIFIYYLFALKYVGEIQKKKKKIYFYFSHGRAIINHYLCNKQL